MQDANWFIGWPADRWDCGATLDAAIHALELPKTSRRLDGVDRHVTLAFLGRCGQPAAERAFAEATTQADTMPAELSLRGTGWQLLGPPRAPSAVSLLVNADAGRLETLIAAHRGALYAAAGAAPDTRPPKPHVTVARLDRRLPDADRECTRRRLDASPPPDGELVLDRLTLFTWTESRDRRLFRRVASTRLGPT